MKYDQQHFLKAISKMFDSFFPSDKGVPINSFSYQYDLQKQGRLEIRNKEKVQHNFFKVKDDYHILLPQHWKRMRWKHS
jgi:hypothetical protein